MGAFFVTVFMGFVGTFIDMIIVENLRMDGDFGAILAIATMGSFILSRIGRNDPADENTVYKQAEEELEPDELPAEEPDPEELEQDESDNDTDQT